MWTKSNLKLAWRCPCGLNRDCVAGVVPSPCWARWGRTWWCSRGRGCPSSSCPPPPASPRWASGRPVGSSSSPPSCSGGGWRTRPGERRSLLPGAWACLQYEGKREKEMGGGYITNGAELLKVDRYHWVLGCGAWCGMLIWGIFMTFSMNLAISWSVRHGLMYLLCVALD